MDPTDRKEQGMAMFDYSWQVVDRPLRDGDFADQLAKTPDQTVKQLSAQFPNLNQDDLKSTVQ